MWERRQSRRPVPKIVAIDVPLIGPASIIDQEMSLKRDLCFPFVVSLSNHERPDPSTRMQAVQCFQAATVNDFGESVHGSTGSPRTDSGVVLTIPGFSWINARDWLQDQ